MRSLVVFTLCAAAAAAAGCAKREAPAAVSARTTVVVRGITLGREIGADQKVATPRETFGVRDPVYASIETAGQGRARLRAVWSRVNGKKLERLSEQARGLHSTGSAATAFHVESTEPWPKGNYRVDVYLDNGLFPAATHTFTIQ